MASSTKQQVILYGTLALVGLFMLCVCCCGLNCSCLLELMKKSGHTDDKYHMKMERLNKEEVHELCVTTELAHMFNLNIVDCDGQRLGDITDTGKGFAVEKKVSLKESDDEITTRFDDEQVVSPNKFASQAGNDHELNELFESDDEITTRFDDEQVVSPNEFASQAGNELNELFESDDEITTRFDDEQVVSPNEFASQAGNELNELFDLKLTAI